MNKNIFLLAIGIALAAFIFPKQAGSTCGFCPGPPSIHRQEYGCIGFKYDYYPQGCLDCGTQIYCMGIVTADKTCYTEIAKQRVEVPNCKPPTTPEEILAICPECYQEASAAAYKQGNLSKAVELCTSINKEDCIRDLAYSDITANQLDRARFLCVTYLDRLKETCLENIAQQIARSNLEGGVEACGELEQSSIRDMCYHNIAVIAAEGGNTERALQICDQIIEDLSTPPCKELVHRIGTG